MSGFVIAAGIAWGMLLAALGLSLWDGFRGVPAADRIVQIISWLTEAALLVAWILVWRSPGSNFAPLALTSTAAAALSALTDTQHPQRSPWSRVAMLLPGVALIGGALFWSSTSVNAGNPEDSLIGSGLLLCSIFGARTLSEALGGIVDDTSGGEWPSTVTYTLLTMLTADFVMVNLWRRGMAWSGHPGELDMVAAWLAWSAARLAPQTPARLKPALTSVAALTLIALTVL